MRRIYSFTKTHMEAQQWQGLHGGAPSNVSIAAKKSGFKVKIDGLTLLELNELLAHLRRSRGAA